MRRFSKYVLIGSSLLAAVLSACGGGSSSTSDGGDADVDTDADADTDTDTDVDTDSDTDTDTDTDTGEPTCWWDPMETGTSAYFTEVVGVSSEKLYAGGMDYFEQEGVLLEYDGVQWTRKWSFDNRFPDSIWGSSEDELYAMLYGFEVVDEEIEYTDSSVFFWDGISWGDTSAIGSALDLFGFSPTDLFSASFAVYHFNGSEWSLFYDQGNLPGEPEGSVHAIWGAAPDDVWFVGGKGDYDGFIMHYDGEEFEEIPTTADLLNDIHGVSADEIYAVGNDYGGYEATVLKYDGNAWSTIGFFDDPEKYNALSGVWAAGNGEVFVAGHLFIYHFDGSIWETFAVPEGSCPLSGVWGLDEERVFVVGGTPYGISCIMEYSCP